MATVEAAKSQLFRSEIGSGQAVVFVHGIPTDYRAWESVMAAFPTGFRAVSYSRRYAYPNRRDGDVRDSTIENNASDLAELIGALGIAPVHLVGHSYGGFIAAFLAANQGRLLKSLTLVEPAIGSLLLRNPRNRGEALALLFRRPATALSASRFLRQFNAPSLEALARGDGERAVRFNVDGVEDREGAFDQLAEGSRRMMLDNARTVREVDLPYPPLTRTELGQIRVPTLVVSGQTSALWLRTIGEITAKAIPGARRVTISNTGHYPHLQHAGEFTSRLISFIQGPSTRA